MPSRRSYKRRYMVAREETRVTFNGFHHKLILFLQSDAPEHGPGWHEYVEPALKLVSITKATALALQHEGAFVVRYDPRTRKVSELRKEDYDR